ncbi:FAD:protein FMN transferase [Flavobacteriaceae bacterium]|nr:FAD:protein FMN transferase [Flavobacteriaceae bacterium]
MKKAFFIFLFSSLFTLISCKNEINTPIELQGFVFGTSYNIIYYDVGISFEEEIIQLFEDVNNSISTYIPTSDISRINNGDVGVIVDTYFKEVFYKSEQIFKETNGYFDPTVGNLVNAWGFGPEKPLNNLDSSSVKDLMKFVGFDKVKIENNQVNKKYSETYFDFNSIGKGYGLDIIARFLESKKVANYLIEIGGEVRVKGTKPEGKIWTVQLENPNTDGTRSAYTYLQLTNSSMASSGNYRKFRMAPTGEKYVHTINPKTGFALESNLLAATVIAELDCADVDAYATAFMAMGLEKTVKFLEDKPHLKVVLIYVNEAGDLAEFRN